MVVVVPPAGQPGHVCLGWDALAAEGGSVRTALSLLAVAAGGFAGVPVVAATATSGVLSLAAATHAFVKEP